MESSIQKILLSRARITMIIILDLSGGVMQIIIKQMIFSCQQNLSVQQSGGVQLKTGTKKKERWIDGLPGAGLVFFSCSFLVLFIEVFL